MGIHLDRYILATYFWDQVRRCSAWHLEIWNKVRIILLKGEWNYVPSSRVTIGVMLADVPPGNQSWWTGNARQRSTAEPTHRGSDLRWSGQCGPLLLLGWAATPSPQMPLLLWRGSLRNHSSHTCSTPSRMAFVCCWKCNSTCCLKRVFAWGFNPCSREPALPPIWQWLLLETYRDADWYCLHIRGAKWAFYINSSLQRHMCHALGICVKQKCWLHQITRCSGILYCSSISFAHVHQSDLSMTSPLHGPSFFFGPSRK